MQDLLGDSQELKSYSKSNRKPLKALKLSRVMVMEMKRGEFIETFLMVQWLGVCASKAGGIVRSLVRESRSHILCGQKIFLKRWV